MPAVMERANLERFRAAIARRLGLRMDDEKVDSLADLLQERIEASCRGQISAYLDRLGSNWIEEWRTLAEQLTVTETYFFRYWDHLRAFSEIVLPACLQTQYAQREVRILSAGSASGEEAYSLAMLARALPEPVSGAAHFKITGIDVNHAMIRKALRGIYSAWSLRETPENFQVQNFQLKEGEFVLDPAVRAMVTFEERNLLDDNPDLWQPSAWDVVFCRNVLMYFHPAAMRTVVERIARAIRPGGFLFLGHAETLRGVSDRFHLRHTHEAFYYERKQAHEQDLLPAIPEVRFSQVQGPGPVPMLNPDTSWVDAIQAASRRIAALTDRPAERNPAPERTEASRKVMPAPAAGLKRPWEVEIAVDLLGKERFEEAMDHLQAMPPGSENDPDVLLLSAVILTNRGDLAAAEAACRSLLGIDELNAGAHYLMALCREHGGQRRAALDHDQTAAYLDPGFAMPHLHMGLLAKRKGDFETAGRELGQAIALLEKEDASRILLFGGGFCRESLRNLCRNELHSCGGPT